LALSDLNVIEIELPICHAASDRPMTEIIEVLQLSPLRYRLVFSPGMVEGLAKGDEIELCSEDPKGFNVVKRSRNLCIWFFFQEIGRNQGPDGDRVRAIVEEFGGTCDGGGNTHLVLSIPLSFGFPAVEELFKDMAKRYPGSSWLYGNVYDPWNGFRPLGWWE
jgi:hypothetical protein